MLKVILLLLLLKIYRNMNYYQKLLETNKEFIFLFLFTSVKILILFDFIRLYSKSLLLLILNHI